MSLVCLSQLYKSVLYSSRRKIKHLLSANSLLMDKWGNVDLVLNEKHLNERRRESSCVHAGGYHPRRSMYSLCRGGGTTSWPRGTPRLVKIGYPSRPGWGTPPMVYKVKILPSVVLRTRAVTRLVKIGYPSRPGWGTPPMVYKVKILPSVVLRTRAVTNVNSTYMRDLPHTPTWRFPDILSLAHPDCRPDHVPPILTHTDVIRVVRATIIATNRGVVTDVTFVCKVNVRRKHVVIGKICTDSYKKSVDTWSLRVIVLGHDEAEC